MSKAPLGTISWCTRAILLGWLGCTPLTDLSSYSNGAPLEQRESLPPREEVPDAVAAPAGQSEPAPLVPPLMREDDSTSAPLDLAPTNTESVGATPAGPTPAAVDAVDPCSAAGGFTIAATSSCYRRGERTASWSEARTACQAWGGDLVEIGSQEENLQLAGSISGSVWIGATDEAEEGTFRWVGGGVVEFMAWGDGQPNNLEGLEDCAVLGADDAQWTDVRCVDRFSRQSLCERPQSASTADAG